MTHPRTAARGRKKSHRKAQRLKPRVDREARTAEYLRIAARVFLTRGANASIREIADRAGAPKPVFYRIFPSRAQLIDAFFQHVDATIAHVQQGKWEGYGWALRTLYREAKKDKEIFLVALHTFRSDPALEPWRQRLLDRLQEHAIGFFHPTAGAPPGASKRAVHASRTLSSLSFHTLVAWLQDLDGLSDEARFRWWGRIIREWRKATREAFSLDPPVRPR